MTGPGLHSIGPSRRSRRQFAPIDEGRDARRDWKVLAGCGAVLVLVLAQLSFGAGVLVTALSVSSILIGFFPLAYLGRDLYTCFAALYCFRYTGGALLMKTLYGQPVDTYLQNPVASYALANLLLVVVITAVLLARRIDKGGTSLPVLTSPESLRATGLVAFLIGTCSGAVSGALVSRDSDVASTGAVFVIASALLSLVYLGYASEILHKYQTSGGREMVSKRLLGMLAVAVIMSVFLNIRSLMINSCFCVLISGFLLRSIHIRHVVAGIFAFAFFSFYVSPLSLELRTIKEGKAAGEFLSSAKDMVLRTIDDPSFISELKARERFRQQFESGQSQYDYFGDNANIANRLSFIGILDAVYSQAHATNSIGTRGFEEVYARVVPGFLVAKEARNYGYGDWLSWEMGLIEFGRISFLSFPLPAEGIALFGIPGMVLFPIVFLLPVLIILGRISSLRYVTAPSLFLVSALHWELVEGPSETFISIVVRSLPILVAPVACLYWLWTQRRPASEGPRLRLRTP